MIDVIVLLQEGTPGQLDELAKKFAVELHTHYQDVLERLEDMYRRKVNNQESSGGESSVSPAALLVLSGEE